MSHFLHLVMSFIICVLVSFVFGWKLALAMVSYIPIIVISNAIVGKVGSHNHINLTESNFNIEFIRLNLYILRAFTSV